MFPRTARQQDGAARVKVALSIVANVHFALRSSTVTPRASRQECRQSGKQSRRSGPPRARPGSEAGHGGVLQRVNCARIRALSGVAMPEGARGTQSRTEHAASVHYARAIKAAGRGPPPLAGPDERIVSAAP